MKNSKEKLIAEIIRKGGIQKDYPKKGIHFLAIDTLLQNAHFREMVSEVVTSVIDEETFSGVAPIASRGYIFSGMITSKYHDKGEYLVQKVKSKGDARYEQLATTTEYSTDALQILKGTIKPGKNYLIADDLIATGGSAKTAISLIRKCGGKVDTLVVLTELTDLGAREALEKEGVKLISLLQLSGADLEKMLFLQSSYQETPQAPISYQLSKHSLGAKALIKSNHDEKTVTVHLASASPLKKEATQLAMQGMFDPLETQVMLHETESGVNAQPFGPETIEGARNRLQSLVAKGEHDDSAMLVSIENGMRFSAEDNTYFDFVHVMVKKGGKTFAHTEDCCEIPQTIINAMAKGQDQTFQETWGDAAKRLGYTSDAKNPHKEVIFGGVSRTTHLNHALCKALGTLKSAMLAPFSEDSEAETFEINRLVELSDRNSKDKYAERGITFSSALDIIKSKAINFYNQGCPVDTWKIPKDKLSRNRFKVFQTGDPFAIMSSDIEISGANIIIHVGVSHGTYSPDVLLQEALQLCRCAYEHGARSITVALPDAFHPVINVSDFNILLMKQLKASGANKLYFYDKLYVGKLDESNRQATIPFTLSDHSDKEQYQIAKQALRDVLHFPKDTIDFNETYSLDKKIMHFMRRTDYQQAWSQFDSHKTDILTMLSEHQLIPGLSVPERQFQSHVILCCTANKTIAEKIARSLRLQGEMVSLYHIEGEGIEAKIPSDVSICGATVTIVQSTHPNPDNVEKSTEYMINGASSYFFEAASIAKQAGLRGAASVNLINPYQFGARSDKAEDNANGKTGAYVQQNGLLLKASGVNQVITAECHDIHTMSGTYTGANMRGSAVSALSVIASRLAREWLLDCDAPMQGQIRLVTPDAGAAKRTKELTKQLQTILGTKLSDRRVLGEKQRDSHQDNSATISSLNSGDVKINPRDKYLITDDETATGSTLCQAITGLREKGAKDIAVIVVHNNMPLHWLLRQLCLARFLYMGVNELHFSDTHEMGTLANDYDDLIDIYGQQSKHSRSEIQEEVFTWFKDNIVAKTGEIRDEVVRKEFSRFTSMFSGFKSSIRIHSLANEFANKVKTQPYMSNSYAFIHETNEIIKAIKGSASESIVVFEGVSVAAASAAAFELDLPLHVVPNRGKTTFMLPQSPFALIGTSGHATLKSLASLSGHEFKQLQAVNEPAAASDLVLVSGASSMLKPKGGAACVSNPALTVTIEALLVNTETCYQSIKTHAKWKASTVKLLAIGIEGQALAGRVSYLLATKGIHVGIVPVEDQSEVHQNTVVFSGESKEHRLTADRNALGMGDVCIAVGAHITKETEKAISALAVQAKIHCPYSCSVLDDEKCHVRKPVAEQVEHIQPGAIYAERSRSLFFQPKHEDGAKELAANDISSPSKAYAKAGQK